MLIMRGPQNAFLELSDDEHTKVVSDYVHFFEELEKMGVARDGEGFSNMTTQLKMQDGQLVQIDRPFRNTENELSGYYLIEMENFEQAVELAKSCPALKYGESVEIVPLGH
jgi:hypothetical protein